MPETRSEPPSIIDKLRALNERFYWDCFKQGVGSEAHSFIEFNGLMNAYIQYMEKAVAAGIELQTLNAHGGVAVQVEGHTIQYLAEKLDCILGPIISSSPMSRAILLKELFGIVE